MNFNENLHPPLRIKNLLPPKRIPPVNSLAPAFLLPSVFSLSVKTYVQALTSICRLASQRLSEHMHEIVRITLSFIENVPSTNTHDDQQHDDELIEYCLQALETFLKRCPKETNEFVPKIVKICIVYLKYDPNFNYDGKTNIDLLAYLILSCSLSRR